MRICTRMTILVVVLATAPVDALGQAPTRNSYSDYYTNTLKTYRRPPVDPERYTYDKYFYNRPSVSPYTNLTRRNPTGSTSYQAYVRPQEQKRLRQTVSEISPQRQQVFQPQIDAYMKTQGVKSPKSSRPSSPTNYYGHWYSGRKKLGLE